jgi:nitrile hydratase accessory protein
MTQGRVSDEIAYLDGAAALPRRNGELVFNAPWEGRAFGMAVVLNEKGQYPWDDFRSSLVEAIASGGTEYYASWLNALQSLLESRGVVTQAEVEDRAREYENLARDPVF